MREIVKKVADLIRDLVALNLLKPENVSTKLAHRSLVVKIVVKDTDLSSCIEMFEELKGDLAMSVIESNRENPTHSILVVEFRRYYSHGYSKNFWGRF